MFKRSGIIFVSTVLCFALTACSVFGSNKTNSNGTDSSNKDNESYIETAEDIAAVEKSKYFINDNTLDAFDLAFLQLENAEKNKIYSPLSIKYALKMLEEATTGVAKAQISSVIGNYAAKNYPNSKNMSFANAMFIKDSFRKSINNDYVKLLATKYNAHVITDPFTSPNTINDWVSNKTLGLIKNPLQDVSGLQFMLINALAIDMEWQHKFLEDPQSVSYDHENFYWSAGEDLVPFKFEGVNRDVSGMEITTSYNNYDIVKTLGEDNIKKTVRDAYLKYIEECGCEFGDGLFWDWDDEFDHLTGEEKFDVFFDNYFYELNSNYKRFDKTTDFSFYVNNDVKVFAKDLKTYNGITLQYVGIMPTKENLSTFISKTTPKNINNLIKNLKNINDKSIYKKGVVTQIVGNIPKFKFSYELNLLSDLKKMGVTNVFEQGKANLTNLSSDKSLFIGNVKHTANIEFTQDGIKAAAATFLGGIGAPAIFDYYFDVPVEKIDLNFNKPYMFLIRDKKSGEVWFTGTVYTPLLYDDDKTTGENYEW